MNAISSKANPLHPNAITRDRPIILRQKSRKGPLLQKVCKKKNRLSDEFPCFGDKLPFIPDFSWKYSNDNNGRRNNLHQKKKKNNNKFIKDISFFYCDLQLLNLCIHSRNLPRDNSINRNGSNQFYRQIWLCCRAGINLIL